MTDVPLSKEPTSVPCSGCGLRHHGVYNTLCPVNKGYGDGGQRLSVAAAAKTKGT